MARILVIEDDADLAGLAQATLEGHHVDVTYDGIHGLDYLLRHIGDQPDLVLLDIQMPELDGWAVLEQIRNVDALAQLPVIVCSVRSSDADRTRAAELGATDYLAKPYTLDQLRQIVADHIARVIN